MDQFTIVIIATLACCFHTSYGGIGW